MDETRRQKYEEIGQALRINVDHAEINHQFFEQQNINVPDKLSRNEAIAVFNQTAEANNLTPLTDPLGYMTLPNSMMDTVKNTYHDKYEDAAVKMENGIMSGGSHGMRKILTKVNNVSRHDLSKYLPEKMPFSDLRFVPSTKEMEKTIDDFVSERVRLTYSYTIKRSVESSTFTDIKNNMDKSGQKLTDQLLIATGQKEQPKVLSSTVLRENSNNDEESLKTFASQLAHPETVTKGENDEHATASFQTNDRKMARFLIKNKQYLSDFGFNIQKSSGAVSTSWQSQNVDKVYAENNPTLDMGDLKADTQQL